jgi:hypothetical protein
MKVNLVRVSALVAAVSLVTIVTVLFSARLVSREAFPVDKVVRILYRQSARWAVASVQDISPLIAVLHANYAAGYLWAIKDIVTPEEFARATGGADFLALESRIVAIQDAATRKLVAVCKEAVPVADETLLAAIYYSAPDQSAQ